MPWSTMSSDIVHEILISLPDFKTLSAAITVSKAFYDVFQIHPKSITHAVARNVVGPALPQAARLAHYVHQRSSDNDDSRVQLLPDESQFQDSQWRLDRHIAGTLEEHARAVRTLEDFYSLRHKDRTSPSSALEWTEALRFRRAVYRYMLCYDLLTHEGFSRAEDSDTTDDDDDEEHDMENNIEAVQAQCTKFFEDYSSEELFELLEICAFAKDTKLWHFRACWEIGAPFQPAEETPVDLVLLATQLEERRPDSTYYDQYVGHEPISKAVAEALRARKVPEARLKERATRAIVTFVHGDKDCCSRCHAECGVALLGQSNLSTLAGILSFRERVLLLPGLLPRNQDEKLALLRHFHNQHRVHDEALICEMMDMEVDGEDADDGQWSKDEWYCLECIKQLFRQRFMLWWRDAKLRSGAPPKEDCWYGYNCRTMTHRPSHATKLNHLCKPTRGEAPHLTPGNPQ
ncbi:hypothetical protein BV20DRAFT_1011510 [Pilatotrama ljubarskyi]|nr:hypothetical protein BV20DRAFT_1011510 [Pilatotrama ljubarskyi]